MSRLLEPQLWLFFLTALALGNLWRQRKESRRRLLLVTWPFAALAILSTAAVSQLALGSLEWSFPPLDRKPEDVQAIVVLAGNVRFSDSPSEGPSLGSSTLNRCIKAAKVYHQGKPCPVIISGGQTEDSQTLSLAGLMKNFLLQLGVKSSDLIVEADSRNTHDNAVLVSKILQQRGIGKILLVTDACHLRRALASFRRQGVQAIVPCGCRYRADVPRNLADFLPDVNGLRNVQDACHEWLGVAWYWMRNL